MVRFFLFILIGTTIFLNDSVLDVNALPNICKDGFKTTMSQIFSVIRITIVSNEGVTFPEMETYGAHNKPDFGEVASIGSRLICESGLLRFHWRYYLEELGSDNEIRIGTLDTGIQCEGTCILYYSGSLHDTPIKLKDGSLNLNFDEKISILDDKLKILSDLETETAINIGSLEDDTAILKSDLAHIVSLLGNGIEKGNSVSTRLSNLENESYKNYDDDIELLRSSIKDLTKKLTDISNENIKRSNYYELVVALLVLFALTFVSLLTWAIRTIFNDNMKSRMVTQVKSLRPSIN